MTPEQQDASARDRGKAYTRRRIQEVALESFVEKGYNGATIGEIAARAGVAETTIYEHFRNKEDILFSIPRDFFSRLCRSLEDHFLGVDGVENLFRKFVWHHLHFFQENPQSSALYILELWNNPAFLETKGFSYLAEYRARLEGVLESGQREGIFDPKLPKEICASMVLGTFNHLILSKVMLKRPLELIPYADRLFKVFRRVLEPTDAVDQRVFRGQEGRRKDILMAALTEFEKHGYEGATIARIAKRAGVTQPTIYEYFKSKEDLLYSIPEVAMQDFLKSLEESLRNLDNPVNRLYNFILHQVRSVRDAPTYYRLLIMELRNNPGFYDSPGYRSLREYSARFVEIVKEGAASGYFRDDVDITCVQNLYFGTFDDLTIQFLLDGKQQYIVGVSEYLFDLTYRALKKD